MNGAADERSRDGPDDLHNTGHAHRRRGQARFGERGAPGRCAVGTPRRAGGRSSSTSSSIDGDEGEELEPDFNVAPTKPVPVILTRRSGRDAASGVGGEGRAVRAASEEWSRPEGPGGRDAAIGRRARSEDVRELHVARWGLVPFWAKDVSIGARLINARVETVHEKPAFRRAFARRRCLVPADGYYEWQTLRSGAKQPYFIRPRRRRRARDGRPVRAVAVAGRPRERLLSCTVITTEATDDVGPHPRPDADARRAGAVRRVAGPGAHRGLTRCGRCWYPPRTGRLESYPVSTAVNKVRNNGPELVSRRRGWVFLSPDPVTLF